MLTMIFRFFYLKIILSISFLLSSQLLAFQVSPIVLSEDYLNRQESIGQHLLTAADPNKEMTPATIMSGDFNERFSDLGGKKALSYGMNPWPFWGYFVVDNSKLGLEEIILEAGYSAIDKITVYRVSESGAILFQQTLGDVLPFSERPIKYRHPAYPLQIGPEKSYFLVKIETTSNVFFDFKIYSNYGFKNAKLTELIFVGILLGGIVTIFFYNLFLFFTIRDRNYGYYVLYIACYFTFSIGYYGVAPYFVFSDWTDRPLTGWGLFVIVDAISITAAAFAIGFLNLRENAKIFYWLLTILASISLVTSLSNILFLHGQIVFLNNITMLTSFLVGILMVLAGCHMILKGYSPAIYFTIAWAFVMSGNCLVILSNGGVIERNFLTTWSQLIGANLEMILLSFALGARINIIKAEKLRVEREMLKETERAREADKRALVASEAALEEQKRLGVLKNNFLANTSHELRTPLNGIIGMSEALATNFALSSDASEAAGQILKASRRLSELIDDILDFSALEGGEIKVSLGPVSLLKTVNECLITQASLNNQKNITTVNQISASGSSIQADASHCRKVINAVLSNAYKFTEHGSVSIRSRVDDGYVEIAIRDTGIGIAEDRLSKLTTAFEQEDGGSARKKGGTGLGLALAYRLMHAQGGDFHVYSTIDVGTTVVLRFPVSEVSVLPVESEEQIMVEEVSQPTSKVSGLDSQDIPPSSRVIDHQALVANKREALILVVDDDDLNRRVINNHLSDGPYKVMEASDGHEALQMVNDHGPFDAILLDVMMPGMTGYEVCRVIRKDYEPTDLPIIMLTAKQQVNDLIEGFSVGANDYVHKPFVKGELIVRLDAHLKIAKSSRAMSRFVPKDFIRMLGHNDLTDVNLGDVVSQDMSIVFSDIQGFTNALEYMEPIQVFDWVNRCYRIVGPEIRKANGFVDKYIGDAVMALFPGSPADAVEAAVAMYNGVEKTQKFKLGTGIHFGHTMLGTLGEPERFDTTVLSDAVNIASRIEGACKLLSVNILVSSAVKESLGSADKWLWRCLGLVRMKGREGAVLIYELLDIDPCQKLKLASQEGFKLGVEAFQQSKINEAKMHFELVVSGNPDDGPARFYLDFCQQIDRNDTSFDGVLVLTEK